MHRWVAATGWLLLLGTAGAWLMMLVGVAGDGGWEMHSGVIVLSAGAAATASITVWPAGRSLWVRQAADDR